VALNSTVVPDFDLSDRLIENPIINPSDVRPSRPGVEVVSVFNAGAVKVGDEVVLLLRVSEQGLVEDLIVEGPRTFDLSEPTPQLRKLEPGHTPRELLPLTYLDTKSEPYHLVDVLLLKDTPGLDCTDPRGLHYTSSGENGHFVNDFLTQMSHLRVARSNDGIHFVVEDHPAIMAESELEEYGCEDPRITLIDGVYHVVYVSVSRIGISASRATTTDFRSFTRQGIMFLPENKDVVLFPEKIGGRYVALSRPMLPYMGRVTGMWLSFSDNLADWGDHCPLVLPRHGMWDETRTGGSLVPIKTEGGWLVIYHGVSRDSHYAVGATLLDLEDPRKVLARSEEPIMAPSAEYECSGLYNNVIFPCGHVALDDEGDKIRVYYGAGDSYLAAADFSVRDILGSLIETL
jgi:beta-1,2-mannobiose phosphorylase / 1,2-beta-oligomannan phosphorylase